MAIFLLRKVHRAVWAERRKQNAELLAHPMLDRESCALATSRIEECERILADLQQNRKSDDA
ncbi:hypothetical protein [Mesorhizobium sangaii]|uniref:Uncharacterized protein n=1 Tax=Mesorhizobium sangaii TaxID=505389 RepID=A0A841PKA6_9HYPH|nr:hypothetical protein [Mesorhizobium sangaii]MBB6414063.1 hypothetical protein [Mesorhizobium sangaii]